jgi:hypothetical protein
MILKEKALENKSSLSSLLVESLWVIKWFIPKSENARNKNPKENRAAYVPYWSDPISF